MSFNLKTSAEQLSLPNAGVSRKRFVTVQPTSSAIGAEFRGGNTVEFKFVNSGLDWWSPQESYMTIRYRLSQTDGATPVTDAGNSAQVCPAFNAPAGLFNTAQYEMGDTLVSSSNNLPVDDSLSKKMSFSRDYHDTIGTQYLLQSSESRLADAQARTDREVNYVPTALSIFRQGNLIPGTTNHRLSFNISSDWYNRFIEATGADKHYAAVGSENAGADNYSLQILDIHFNVCLLEGDRVAPDTSYFLDTREITSYIATVDPAATSHHHTFTVKPTIYRMTMGFQDGQSNSNVTGRQPPTSFKLRDGAPQPLSQLRNYRLTYANQSFPHTQLEIRADAQAGSEERIAKAYQTTMGNWLLDSNGSGWYTLTEWKEEPTFTYSVFKPADDRSTHLEVDFNLAAPVANARVVLITESLSTTQISYNAVGDLSSVVKMDR